MPEPGFIEVSVECPHCNVPCWLPEGVTVEDEPNEVACPKCCYQPLYQEDTMDVYDPYMNVGPGPKGGL